MCRMYLLCLPSKKSLLEEYDGRIVTVEEGASGVFSVA